MAAALLWASRARSASIGKVAGTIVEAYRRATASGRRAAAAAAVIDVMPGTISVG